MRSARASLASSRMQAEKSVAAKRSTSSPSAKGRFTSRITNGFAVLLRRYSQSQRSIYPSLGGIGRGMHYMRLRYGTSSFSIKRLRTVSHDRLSCAVNLTLLSGSSSSGQRARPTDGSKQAVASSRAFSVLVELALCSGRRLMTRGWRRWAQ